MRLAAVSHWSGVVAVSPMTISIRSNRTSSSSAASCASAVRVPVPRSTLPLKIVTRSSGLMVNQLSTASFATDFGAWSVAAPAGPVMPYIENPMASTPLAFRNSRRSNEGAALGVVMFVVVMSASPSGRRRALDRGDDAVMGAAATEIAGKGAADLGFARLAGSSRAGRRRS